MNCHATRAVLDLYAEKRLTARREKSVAAHLASCAECSALSAPAAPVLVKGPESGFKHRLAAILKAERGAPAARPTPESRRVPKLELNLLPKDLFGAAVAAGALALIAVAIGWSGVPTQFGAEGAELAAGRIP